MVTNAEAITAKGSEIADSYSADKVGDHLADTSGGKAITGMASSAQATFESGFKVVDDIAKGDLKALASDAHTTISEANSFLTEGLSTIGEIAMDPLGWLIQNGLEFLIGWIQPLEDALELVTGDPEALTAGADAFSSLGKPAAVQGQRRARGRKRANQRLQPPAVRGVPRTPAAVHQPTVLARTATSIGPAQPAPPPGAGVADHVRVERSGL